MNVLMNLFTGHTVLGNSTAVCKTVSVFMNAIMEYWNSFWSSKGSLLAISNVEHNPDQFNPIRYAATDSHISYSLYFQKVANLQNKGINENIKVL